MSKKSKVLLAASLAAVASLLCQCAPNYGFGPKNYPINETTIPKSSVELDMKLVVAMLDDTRPQPERQKSHHDTDSNRHINNHTFDRDFGWTVAYDATLALVKHLNLSGLFAEPVEVATFGSGDITTERIRSLASQQTDLLLTGELKHFRGYFEKKLWRQWVYALSGVAATLIVRPPKDDSNEDYGIFSLPLVILGAVSGLLVEKQHGRDQAYHVALDLNLISVRTADTVWQDQFEITFDERVKVLGPSGNRRCELAVQGLVEILDDVVKSIKTTATSNGSPVSLLAAHSSAENRSPSTDSLKTGQLGRSPAATKQDSTTCDSGHFAWRSRQRGRPFYRLAKFTVGAYTDWSGLRFGGDIENRLERNSGFGLGVHMGYRSVFLEVGVQSILVDVTPDFARQTGYPAGFLGLRASIYRVSLGIRWPVDGGLFIAPLAGVVNRKFTESQYPFDLHPNWDLSANGGVHPTFGVRIGWRSWPEVRLVAAKNERGPRWLLSFSFDCAYSPIRMDNPEFGSGRGHVIETEFRIQVDWVAIR